MIKVERPGVGEQARRFPGDPPGMDSHSFLLLNKKSVTVNVKTPEGGELIRQLIQKSDMFIEDYGPGVIERLGLDYDSVRQMNPRIIYAQSRDSVATDRKPASRRSIPSVWRPAAEWQRPAT